MHINLKTPSGNGAWTRGSKRGSGGTSSSHSALLRRARLRNLRRARALSFPVSHNDTVPYAPAQAEKGRRVPAYRPWMV